MRREKGTGLGEGGPEVQPGAEPGVGVGREEQNGLEEGWDQPPAGSWGHALRRGSIGVGSWTRDLGDAFWVRETEAIP